MSEEEIKERLNYFKTISILYGNTFAMSIEVLKQLQKDIETVLQLLEQKDNKINKVIDKLKLFKNDLKEYDKKYESKKDVPVGAIGIRINELLKILEE